MRGLARAILVGGFIVTAQAAMADGSAFPGSADDAGVQLSARATYADTHAGDRLVSVETAFPGKAPDGVFLPPRVTYADTHAADRVMSAASAFPSASDDAGAHLIARTTYADTHLAHVQSPQSAE